MLLTFLCLSGTQIKDLRITTAGTQMDARDPGASPPILALCGSTAISNSVVSVIINAWKCTVYRFSSGVCRQVKETKKKKKKEKELTKFTASSSCSSPLVWDPHRNVVCREQRRGGFVY